MKTISVIMPVYNAAATLRRSLDSIAAQSYPNIELCIVIDCSKDDSLAVAEEFRKDFEKNGRKLTIITHETNQGVAAARNTALDAVSGDYVCYVDADDTLSPEALSVAVAKAGNKDFDIIGWDWTLLSAGGSRYMRQPDCRTPEEALKKFMGGTLRWNLWLFLVKRSLYEGVRFVPGLNMGEDMMVMGRILMKAKSYSFIHQSMYSYLQTDSSVSRTMSDGNIRQVSGNVEIFGEKLAASTYSGLAVPYLDYLKLNVKLPLLISTDKSDYLRWKQWFPESEKEIMSNPFLPFRTKLLQKMASMRFWIGVRLYNELVYGLLIRMKR